ncbi:hypothetical protein [Caudoviricetes sp.]|nr:hypothetical protein [Caudoviricetes sp.]
MSRKFLPFTTIVHRVKYAMQVNNHNQSDLARCVDSTPANISNWLNGKCEPNFTARQKLYRYAYQTVGVCAEDQQSKPSFLTWIKSVLNTPIW